MATLVVAAILGRVFQAVHFRANYSSSHSFLFSSLRLRILLIAPSSCRQAKYTLLHGEHLLEEGVTYLPCNLAVLTSVRVLLLGAAQGSDAPVL